MSIRFCHPRNFKRLIEYDRAGNRFNGLVGDPITAAFYTVSKVLNMTVEIQADDAGVGVYRGDLNRYDGCLGEIQMNRSDMILQMNPYPIEIEDVSQGLIFYETSLMFIAAYNKTGEDGQAQLLESFYGFEPNLWGLCFFTWLLMTGFIIMEEAFYRWMRKEPKTKDDNAFYQVVTHCTQVGAIDDGELPRRLLFMSASVFALLVVNYFSSMIKTDLVTIKDPLVFESYDDIIERGAIPMFMRGQSYRTLFSEPGAEPYRKKLWDYAIETFGERRIYVDLSAFSFLIMCVSVLKQKVIALADESIMTIIGTSGCSLASRDLGLLPGLTRTLKSPKLFENMLIAGGATVEERKLMLQYAEDNDLLLYSEPEVLVHIARDPREQSYNQGLIYTSQNKWLKKHLEKCTRRMLEVGWIGHEVGGLEKVDLFEGNPHVEGMLGPSLAKRRPAVQRCLSKSIIKPDVGYQAVNPRNLTSLMQLTASIYLLLSVLLVCEIWWKKFTDSLSPRPSRARAFDGVIPSLTANDSPRWRPIAQAVVVLHAKPATRRLSRSAGMQSSTRQGHHLEPSISVEQKSRAD